MPQQGWNDLKIEVEIEKRDKDMPQQGWNDFSNSLQYITQSWRTNASLQGHK